MMCLFWLWCGFFFSSRRRHTRSDRDWSSDVCSSDLPHRYSRTRDLFEDFVQVLSSCDALLLLEVYSAGEDEIPGADSRTLCRSIRQRGLVDPIYVQNIQEVNEILRDVIQADDIIITQGAGSVSKLVKILADSNLSQDL